MSDLFLLIHAVPVVQPISPNGMDAPERDCCPYVDLGHARCGDRFRLDSLEEALDTCFSDDHRCCAAFAAIRMKHGNVGPPPVPVIITVSSHERLRPTGT
ncbi:MAG: hypothetical protein QGI75_05715 [Phycisphaerales bacterium]|nr:hypothetical protein [Phycisphaerales bacterium]